ncbi:hypothetical protein [Helicobacter acinonychis]|uniref:hypothetical protein n=1 Tax=Helicobacter acinonychis TaxID=212 RepID=UPI0002ED929D|nr:hypothetical protein [Helicobacter acinonychis]STP04985.1 Uncharacterised protein [Helicobacter acinonychis]
MQDSVKKQEEIAQETETVRRSVYDWVDQCESQGSRFSAPSANINRNLRMLNGQAFKALQSQDLLDPQARKELDEALGSITNARWYCRGHHSRQWNA